MTIFKKLFGKKICEDDFRNIAGMILVSGVGVMQKIQEETKSKNNLPPEYMMEFIPIGLHYLSRVALHTGGGLFQDLIYTKVWDCVVDNMKDNFSSALNISPTEAKNRLESRIREREVEYSRYTTSYTVDENKEGTLFWAAAKHIDDAAGFKSNDSIKAIGGILLNWAATIGFEALLKDINRKM